MRVGASSRTEQQLALWAKARQSGRCDRCPGTRCWNKVRQPYCRLPLDNCDPWGRRMSAAGAACPCAAHHHHPAIVHSAVRAAIGVFTVEAVLARRLCFCRLLRGMGLSQARTGLDIGLGLIVGVSLTSTAPATMPLPFTLSRGLSLIRLRLGLILLCHACTSRCVGNSCSLLRYYPPRTGLGRGSLQLMFPLG